MTYAYKRIRLSPTTTRDEHRLVVERLLGRRLSRWEVVHHINGDTADNRPENLEITTLREHAQHHLKGKPGVVHGEHSGTHRLRERDIHLVRALLRAGWTQRAIAKMFKVSQGCIKHIHQGHTWAWLRSDT